MERVRGEEHRHADQVVEEEEGQGRCRGQGVAVTVAGAFAAAAVGVGGAAELGLRRGHCRLPRSPL